MWYVCDRYYCIYSACDAYSTYAGARKVHHIVYRIYNISLFMLQHDEIAKFRSRTFGRHFMIRI